MAKGATSVLHCASVLVVCLVLWSQSASAKDVSYSVQAPLQGRFGIEIRQWVEHRYRRQADTTSPAPLTSAPPSTSLAPTTPPTSTQAPSTSTPSTTTITSSTSTPSTSTPSTSTPPTSTPTSSTPPSTSSTPASTTPTTTGPTTGPSTVRPDDGTTVQTQTIEDTHKYYVSKIVSGEVDSEWVEMANAQRHQMLSASHRTAVTIDLNFKFRFYGHNITNVTVATGGFIYASPFLHQWLTATQYIAPLMANFDTTLGNYSDVYYQDFGNRFIVEWSKVHLKDQEASGAFSFQVHLYANGVIKFLYKELPINIANISNASHPVKVGLSDAFYVDTILQEQGVRRRTIYEYDRVSIQVDKIRQGTVITLYPLRTCNTLGDCATCVAHEDVNFDCKWCSAVGRCSDGLDWHHQEWLTRGCTNTAFSNLQSCAALNASTTSTPATTTTSFSTPSTSPTLPTTVIGTSAQAVGTTDSQLARTTIVLSMSTMDMTTQQTVSVKSESTKAESTKSESMKSESTKSESTTMTSGMVPSSSMAGHSTALHLTSTTAPPSPPFSSKTRAQVSQVTEAVPATSSTPADAARGSAAHMATSPCTVKVPLFLRCLAFFPSIAYLLPPVSDEGRNSGPPVWKIRDMAEKLFSDHFVGTVSCL